MSSTASAPDRRECSSCARSAPKREYSRSQWRKGAGSSRCGECVRAAAAPSVRNEDRERSSISVSSSGSGGRREARSRRRRKKRRASGGGGEDASVAAVGTHREEELIKAVTERVTARLLQKPKTWLTAQDDDNSDDEDCVTLVECLSELRDYGCVNWDQVRTAAVCNPEDAAERMSDELDSYLMEDNRDYPLHFVLRFNPPICVVKALVRAYPDAVKEGYETPLFLAATHGASPEVLRYVYGAQIRSNTFHGLEYLNLNPISFVYMRDVTTKTLEVLLEEFPAGASTATENSLCPLDRLIIDDFSSGRDWGPPQDGESALDRALRKCMFSEHWANGKSSEQLDAVTKISMMLAANERGAVQDEKGAGGEPFRPLHSLLRWISRPSFPARPETGDGDGVAAIIRLWEEHFPTQSQEADGNGALPLHALLSGTWPTCFGGEAAAESIGALLRACPRSAATPDSGGRFPLHLALAHAWPCECIDVLIAAAPRVLQMRDVATRLFPFQMAAACERTAASLGEDGMSGEGERLSDVEDGVTGATVQNQRNEEQLRVGTGLLDSVDMTYRLLREDPSLVTG